MFKLYDMELGENIKFCGAEVLRVPGGWIFTYANSYSQSSVFVPFDNEFMEEPKHE